MGSCSDLELDSDADNQHSSLPVEKTDSKNEIAGDEVDAISMEQPKFPSIVPECPVQFKPFSGQTFCSLDEAYSFYSMYGRVCRFSIRIGSKYRSRDYTTLLQYWICHREGWNFTSKPVDTLEDQDSKVRNRKITRCGCKARVCVKYKGGGQYYVYVFNEEHNHQLASEVGKQFLNANGGSET